MCSTWLGCGFLGDVRHSCSIGEEVRTCQYENCLSMAIGRRSFECSLDILGSRNFEDLKAERKYICRTLYIRQSLCVARRCRRPDDGQATKPVPTGSGSCAITIGTADVTSFAKRVAVVPSVTMTSTFKRTSSPARVRRRSRFPSANLYSTRIFCPSTYPSSRKPC